jgi:hypothetical protein
MKLVIAGHDLAAEPELGLRGAVASRPRGITPGMQGLPLLRQLSNPAEDPVRLVND